MNRDWKVIRLTGLRMDLECGAKKLEIKRPKEQFAKSMFMNVKPGQSLDDGIVELFLKGK